MEYFLQVAANTVILASLYALLALGFNILYSTNRFFDLSYAAYAIVGAYAYLTISTFVPYVSLAIILSVLLTILLSFVVEKYLYVHLRERKSSGAVLMIASLGVLTVIQAIIAIVYTSNVQTLSTGSAIVTLGGVVFTRVQIGIILSAVLAYAASYLLLQKTPLGIQVRAVADDEELAITSQLPVKKLRVITTVIGAGIAAVTTILYGMDTSIGPQLGMQLLLKAIVVAIAGGLGNFMFGIVGAFVLATAENLAVWYIGGEWKDAIAFGILIAVLLIRPTGILKK